VGGCGSSKRWLRWGSCFFGTFCFKTKTKSFKKDRKEFDLESDATSDYFGLDYPPRRRAAKVLRALEMDETLDMPDMPSYGSPTARRDRFVQIRRYFEWQREGQQDADDGGDNEDGAEEDNDDEERRSSPSSLNSQDQLVNPEEEFNRIAPPNDGASQATREAIETFGLLPTPRDPESPEGGGIFDRVFGGR
jgi:hypothetical protein